MTRVARGAGRSEPRGGGGSIGVGLQAAVSEAWGAGLRDVGMTEDARAAELILAELSGGPVRRVRFGALPAGWSDSPQTRKAFRIAPALLAQWRATWGADSSARLRCLICADVMGVSSALERYALRDEPENSD